MIRYEGSKGGPYMHRCCIDQLPEIRKGLGKTCALLTDGRFPAGTSGLSIGHVCRKRPRAARSGWCAMATASASISRIADELLLADDVLAAVPRRAGDANGWKPVQLRTRRSAPLKAGVAGDTSAGFKGAVRATRHCWTRVRRGAIMKRHDTMS